MATFTILHIEWSRGWGGQEMRTVAEAGRLAARGHRLLIVARPQCEILPRARAAGLQTHALPMRRAVDPRAVARLSALIRRERVDLVNTHSSIDSWIGAFAAKWCATRLVRTRHVSIPIRPNLFNFVHRLPDAMITTGESVRQQILASGVLPPDRVVSIPTGVDTAHFAPTPDDGELRRRLGIPAAAPIVATVAVLRQRKRHDLLLRAVSRLQNRHDLYCLLAGEGSQREAIEDLVVELGLEGRVFLLGHLEDVRPALCAATIVVSSSFGMEGVPQALVQALAMAKPVVAADDGSIRELVDNGRTGLLVPPGDPEALAGGIDRFLSDPPLARAAGDNGRRHVVDGYSSERMAERVLALYDRILR